METVLQNIRDLKELTQKDWFEEITKFVVKLVAKKLGLEDAKGGGLYLDDETISGEQQKAAPFEDLDRSMGGKGGFALEIDSEEEDDSAFFARLKTESNNLIRAEGSETLQNYADGGTDDAKGGFVVVATIVAKIAFAVLKRYLRQNHHDFYPTVMEEVFRKIFLDKIGTWGWGQMKEKAGQMFKSNEGLSGDRLHAGTCFLKALETHCLERKRAGKKFETALIGHSAGSIALCHLLEASGKAFPGLVFNQLFFLAPACRTDLFLEKGKTAKEKGVFRTFRMFTMAEAHEKRDHCIPFVYTHSLLYMVSGLFEEETDAKIMGLHEQFSASGRYSDFEELKTLNEFLKDNILVLSADPDNPDESMRSGALKHGDFDNDDLTLKSILKSI
jgi:hypothetical protein